MTQRNTAQGRESWVSPELLLALAELNGQFIDLLIVQANTQPVPLAQPMLQGLRPLLLSLDPDARNLAAACPYLLLDAGLGDPPRWLGAQGATVCDAESGFERGLCPKSSVALVRQVFAYAWHLACSHHSAARVAFGMTEGTAQILTTYTLGQTMAFADHHPHWLQPRWPRNARMWQELLLSAIQGEGPRLEQARMRGVQLLAAEARSSALP